MLIEAQFSLEAQTVECQVSQQVIKTCYLQKSNKYLINIDVINTQNDFRTYTEDFVQQNDGVMIRVNLSCQNVTEKILKNGLQPGILEDQRGLAAPPAG